MIPTTLYNRRGSQWPFATMDVDTFFFVPGRTGKYFSGYVCRWAKRLDRSFRCRSTYMRQVKDEWLDCDEGDKGAVFGCAVWRIA